MNSAHLDLFRAVLWHGGMTRAAAALGIGQPHVSRAIAQFEANLGFPLFVRGHGSAQPTQEGNAFAREADRTYASRNPYGEPQLGRRGLYREVSSGAPREEESFQRAILWVLNLADGGHSLLDVAERADLPFGVVADAAAALLDADLIEEWP